MELTADYKKTEIGIIPNEWDVICLGDVFDFKNGLNKEKQYFGKGTPIVNYMDVYKKSSLVATDLAGKVTLTSQEIKTYEVKKGDVFFTRTSETVDEIGVSSVMLEDVKDTVFSGFVLRARPINERLDITFKKYCFSTQQVRKEITSKSSYTTRALTNGRLLSGVKLAVPKSLSEQAAIATALSDVDALISNLEKLITKKRNIKQGAMQKLLQPKEGWELKKLGDVLRIKHGKDQKSIQSENGIYPILGTGGLMGFTNAFLHNKPSVLIGRKGTIDKPQFMKSPFWTVDTLFYTEIFKGYDAKFIYYIFNLIDWYSYNEASGVPSLNAKTIEKIEKAFPDFLEQTRISEILSDIDAEITGLENKLEKYRNIKLGMMQNLLTGKIRII